jgi:hypothetical protein
MSIGTVGSWSRKGSLIAGLGVLVLTTKLGTDTAGAAQSAARPPEAPGMFADSKQTWQRHLRNFKPDLTSPWSGSVWGDCPNGSQRIGVTITAAEGVNRTVLHTLSNYRGYVVAKVVNRDQLCTVHGYAIPPRDSGYLLVRTKYPWSSDGIASVISYDKPTTEQGGELEVVFCKREEHTYSWAAIEYRTCDGDRTAGAAGGDSGQSQKQDTVRGLNHVATWMTCSQGCCLARPKL